MRIFNPTTASIMIFVFIIAFSTLYKAIKNKGNSSKYGSLHQCDFVICLGACFPFIMHDQPFLLFFVFFGSCFFTFILSFALFQLNASTKSLIKGNFSIYNISALCNSLTSITYYQVYSQHACFKCDSTYLFDLVLNRFQTDFSKIYIAQNNFSPSIFL